MNTHKPLWRVFLAFLGPMMGANILQALSGTINNVFYGQMLGVGALAAVTAFFPVLFFFISFIIGLGAGASVLIGQAYGARDRHKIKMVAGTAYFVTIAISLTVTVLGIVFLKPLLEGLGTPADIFGDAEAYALVMLIAGPPVFVFLMATMVLRGVGDTLTPMIALTVSTAVGLFLTPALIKGWMGLPKVGITAGAYATLASNVLSMAWMSVHMLRRNHPLAPDGELFRHLRIDTRIFKAILSIGVPTGVQMVVVSLAEVALLSFVNRFGSEALAAYGAVNQIISYVHFPAMSIAITASILGAQAIGAGRNERLGTITRMAILFNIAITGGLVLTGYGLSETILGMFLTSAAVIALAQDLLHIVLWSLVIFGIGAALLGIMRASGTVLVPTGLSILSILAVEIPVAYVLSYRIGVEGIWIAYPASFTAMMLFQAAYYRLVWRKKSFKRLI